MRWAASRSRSRSYIAYIAFCAVVATVYFLAPWSLAHLVLYNGIGLSGAIAVVVGVRRHRPASAMPWYVVAVGLVLFTTGDGVYYAMDNLLHVTPPFPSIADVFYLAFYPAQILGLLLMIGRRSGRDRAGLIDGLIVAGGMGALSWVFLINPYVHGNDLSLPARLTGVAYPVMDIFVLAMAARLAMSGGTRRPAFWLALQGLGGLLVADTIYGVVQLTGTWHTGTLVDLGWIVFYVGWGAAALHPSMGSMSEGTRDPVSPTRLTRPRLALLTLAAFTVPAMLPIQSLRHKPLDVGVIFGGSIVMFGLVLSRLNGVLAALDAAVHRQRRGVARERALREGATALVAARDRAAISAAALDGLTQMLVGATGGEKCIALGDADGMRIIGATATNDHIRPSAPFIAALRDGPIAVVADPATRADFGVTDDDLALFVCPIIVGSSLRGALAVAAPIGVHAELADGLEGLSAQTALALERADLADDMLRQRSEARLQSLVKHSSDLITILDADGVIRYQSPSVERMLGHHLGASLGTRIDMLVHPDDSGHLAAVLAKVTEHGRADSVVVDCRFRHRDGEWRQFESICTNLLDDPDVEGIVLNSRDVTERRALESQLQHQAFHDPLTGLANRALFADRVAHALMRDRGQDVAVLFVDVDDFKNVNDSLGHGAGDALLVEVAARLARCVRPGDTTARLGGDEFGILLEGMQSVDDAVEVAQRIGEALLTRVTVPGIDITVTVSTGIAVGVTGVDVAEELQRNADLAMYIAKADGKAGYRVFESSMHTAAVRRLELGADLHQALERGELSLRFQPIVEIATGAIAGVEALSRWRHPERGDVSPLEFVAVAEETGFIERLEEWVLAESAAFAQELRDSYPDRSLFVSVNLSPRHARRSDLVERVAEALDRSGLPAHLLTLEITEGMLMTDTEAMIERLASLRELGVRLAIDDFGTGYSSLSYLQRLPIDVLKIDRSFIDGIADGCEESALARAILKLGSTLRLRTVAEGVEHPEQLAALKSLGCDFAQGFLLSRPLTETELIALLGLPADEVLARPTPAGIGAGG
jgi:diguanylate cyclase (GGDEF)-like protein/PAS domain S-box-containing protein